MEYEVQIEAECYGENPVEDASLLAPVLDRLLDTEVPVSVNEERRLLMVTIQLDAVSARDAHDEALEQWTAAWEQAFPDMPATKLLVIRAAPVGVRA